MRAALVRLDGLGTMSPGRGASIEPQVIVHRYTSEFGSIAGQMSVADVQDALASGQARMDQLSNAYAAYAPTWVNKDHVTFVDWTADWTNLQNRWAAAVTKANAAVSSAKFNIAVPNSMLPAQAEYNGLLKALRQCAPPDGCPVVKGDWDDLNNRLDTAKGAATVYNLPQPTATDADLTLYSATAGADVVAQAIGQEAPKNAIGQVAHSIASMVGMGGSPSGPSQPTSAIKWLFIGAGLGVGGLVGMKVGGIIGAAVGAVFGAGAVELMSLELAASPTVGKAKTATSILAAGSKL